jgi:hypothetical protein
MVNDTDFGSGYFGGLKSFYRKERKGRGEKQGKFFAFFAYSAVKNNK